MKRNVFLLLTCCLTVTAAWTQTPAPRQTVDTNMDKQLSQVVVIGYGTATKEKLTGAVTSINEKDLLKGSSTVDRMFTGKIAGVVVTSDGGAPGSGSRIRIRGGSSLTASNDPLIVIDGVPLDNNTVSGSPERKPKNVY